MRVLISGGGTGGHVYPALAVVAALPKTSSILYVGSESGMEKELIEQMGLDVPFAAIPAAGLRGRAPWTMAHNLVVLWRGTRAAAGLVAEFAPQVVLVTGGYVSIPVGLAAWRGRIPLLLYLPDIVPGLAVRFLSLLAARIATTTSASSPYLPQGKMVVTGYPVRSTVFRLDRRTGREHFAIPMEDKVLLVMGGSRGARSINRAVGSALADFLQKAVVLHVCGNKEDEQWLQQRVASLPAELQARYQLYRYLHDMPLAFAAADVAICRAGASVLGELPAAGLPAVLVPYPYVHQEDNADYMVQYGAAIKVSDSSLCETDGRPSAGALLQALQPLLEDDARYAAMVESVRGLARPDAAKAFVKELGVLAGEE